MHLRPESLPMRQRLLRILRPYLRNGPQLLRVLRLRVLLLGQQWLLHLLRLQLRRKHRPDACGTVQEYDEHTIRRVRAPTPPRFTTQAPLRA